MDGDSSQFTVDLLEDYLIENAVVADGREDEPNTPPGRMSFRGRFCEYILCGRPLNIASRRICGVCCRTFGHRHCDNATVGVQYDRWQYMEAIRRRGPRQQCKIFRAHARLLARRQRRVFPNIRNMEGPFRIVDHDDARRNGPNIYLIVGAKF